MTVVHEIEGSNPTTWGVCVRHKNHCLGHGCIPLLQFLGRLILLLSVGWQNKHQLSV